MKITITIEDQPNDKVKIDCNPNFETMAKAITGGHIHTPAMGYAIRAINVWMEMSKEAGSLLTKLPKIIHRA